MRIEGLTPDMDLYRGYFNELSRVLESQQRADRPCVGCELLCGPHQSPTCVCACAPDCPHTLKQMSSEGERYPIEPAIAPLVHAFLRLRELRPCWSCEGHGPGAGSVARPPRVIFYARSALYPALVAEAIATMLFQKKLSCPWEVAVTPIGNMLDASYTLQPDITGDNDPALSQLQTDVKVIAANLLPEVLNAARKHQSELRKALQGAA